MSATRSLTLAAALVLSVPPADAQGGFKPKQSKIPDADVDRAVDWQSLTSPAVHLQ